MTDYSYTEKEPLLEIKNLSVHYDCPILRNVNLTIRDIIRPGFTQGQVVSLLAPSGMGKTQLFRCIAGLKTPDVGEVFLNEVNGVVKAGMVGVVAQDYPLFPHLTVLDNVVIGARRKIANAAEAKETSIKLLEQFGLGDRHALYPHQLSGGQRQRVAIIQQMVSSGHLLLMDEPFSGLDPLMKDEVERLITRVAAADELNTVILTTHDIGAAIAVSDHIYLLGREKDAGGKPIPGANIRKVYDLMALGLSWRPDIHQLSAFQQLQADIHATFADL
jgi:ABC-type nitrate/sulfonate/bicarbonate transport system ATPase subunit